MGEHFVFDLDAFAEVYQEAYLYANMQAQNGGRW